MERILHEHVLSYQTIGGTGYVSKSSDFPGKRQKLDSYVFTVLQKHINPKRTGLFGPDVFRVLTDRSQHFISIVNV